MVICSATGNANITGPQNGFQDPKLTQLFVDQGSLIPENTTTPITPLPGNDPSLSRLPVGAIVGVVIGGLVLLTVGFFLLRRRQRMASRPQPCEIASTLVEPQEMEEGVIYELHQGPSQVPELPSLPVELSSVLEK